MITYASKQLGTQLKNMYHTIIFRKKHKTFLVKIMKHKDPQSYTQACKIPQWQETMKLEIIVLKQNKT